MGLWIIDKMFFGLSKQFTAYSLNLSHPEAENF